ARSRGHAASKPCRGSGVAGGPRGSPPPAPRRLRAPHPGGGPPPGAQNTHPPTRRERNNTPPPKPGGDRPGPGGGVPRRRGGGGPATRGPGEASFAGWGSRGSTRRSRGRGEGGALISIAIPTGLLLDGSLAVLRRAGAADLDQEEIGRKLLVEKNGL